MSTEAQEQQRRNSRRRKWRRLAVLILVIAVLITGRSVYRHYTNAERIRGFAQDYLRQHVNGKVAIGSADFSWWDGISLFDVSVAGHSPERSSQQQPGAHQTGDVFSCREVRLTHNGLAALRDGFTIESITAFEPNCTIVRDAADGRTNLSSILQPPEGMDPAMARSPGPLPTIELRDAHVQVVSLEDGNHRVLEDLKLTVRALPAPDAPRVFNIVWQEDDDRTAGGHSQIDLQTGRLRNVRGGLPWMSIEAVMLAINARYDGAGAWCSLLGLDGTVRAKDYNLAGDIEAPGTRSATIELSDARISIPISGVERDMTSDLRYLRFERVNGEFELTSDGIRAEFTGSFHGSSCTVSANLRSGVEKLATLGDVDFDAQLSVTGLNLPRPDSVAHPAEARFISRWRQLAGFFRDYDPHGVVDLEIDVAKVASEEESIQIRRAVVTARGGDASCRFFPYRVSDLSGTVEYTPEGVFLREINGQHSGGLVTVDGRAAEPTPEAPKSLTITGKGIPIDRELMDALPRRFRSIHGLFNPEGTIDVQLGLTQPRGVAGKSAKWQTHAEISLVDVSGAYVKFPYRLERTTGNIIVDQDRLRIENLSGHSGNADINLQGDLAFSNGKPTDLTLTIDARNVPFDEKLYAVLPEQACRQLRTFHPSGHLDAEVDVQLDETGEHVGYSAKVAMKNVDVRPNAMPIDITGVTGQLQLTPNEIVLDGLTGRYRNATVSAEGTIGLGAGTHATNVIIRSRDLRVDETLCAALPGTLEDTLAEWKIEGPITTETVISYNPDRQEQKTSVSTTAGLSGSTVGHTLLALPLEDVQAELTIDQMGIRAQNVTAKYGSADVHTSFDITRANGTDAGDITLSMTEVTLDDSLRDLLPSRMRRIWDSLRPSGSIDVHLGSLRFERPADTDRPVWSMDGYVEFSDVALQGLADIRRMSGTLRGSGNPVDRLGGTSLQGSVEVAAFTMFGQPLERVDGRWSYARTAEGQGMLLLDSARGRIHEGNLTGRIEVAFDEEQADYKFNTTIRQMQIEPFINAGRLIRDRHGERINARGLVDAHIYLSGPVGDVSARRGGGRFEIIDGHIYRLPLILAILHVLNLSVPDQDAFDNARAEFYIMGNRVDITDLFLRGSVLALKGTGSITLPDLGVDLSLVTVNPNRWANVPVLTDLVEAASRELVELHVTGPLSQPTVRPRPFRGVTEEIKQLFRKKKPKVTQPG